jgi:hypothetical protein
VAQGFGRLDAELAPGIYKARAAVGSAVQEKLFTVEPGSEAPGPVILDPVRFASPVPFGDTATLQEDHRSAVSEALRRPPLKLGAGAGLLFNLCTPGPVPPEDYTRSFNGFRLYRTSGELLIDFDAAAQCDLEHGYAILYAELDPGGYLLEWSPAGRPTLARPLPLAPGWTTMVFVLAEAEGETGRPLKPDLADCSVQMAPAGKRPDSYPREHLFRLTEIARKALMQGSDTIGRQVLDESLRGKTGNPLLELLTAHLLLLEAEPEPAPLHLLCDRLAGMLGSGHPDLVALRLHLHQLEHPGAPFETGKGVSFPPLLRAGWEILVRQAARDENFFPRGSLCRKMADRVIDNGVWLAWRPQPLRTFDITPLFSLFDGKAPEPERPGREDLLAALGKVVDLEDGRILNKVKGAGGGRDLFKSVRLRIKPDLSRKARRSPPDHRPAKPASSTDPGEMLERLARSLPWDRIVAKLNELDREEDISEKLSSLQKDLIPALVRRHRQLKAGQKPGEDLWKPLIEAVAAPRSVLVENLRDLALLAGELALPLVRELGKSPSEQQDGKSAE